MLAQVQKRIKTTVHPVPTPLSTVILVSNEGWRWVSSNQNLKWHGNAIWCLKPTNYNWHNYEENCNKGLGL
jgi:hypothetical protein